MSLQSNELDGRTLGGKGSGEFLNWAIHHTYDGIQLRIRRLPTRKLKKAFREDIVGPRAIRDAIDVLYQYRVDNGLEPREKHPILNYKPLC